MSNQYNLLKDLSNLENRVSPNPRIRGTVYLGDRLYIHTNLWRVFVIVIVDIVKDLVLTLHDDYELSNNYLVEHLIYFQYFSNLSYKTFN